MSFVQLQVISTNTLMESTMTVEELVLKAKELGYQTLALTDKNVMFGAIEFYELCQKNGIKPIIGLTLDVQGFINDEEYYPLLLLAKNQQGYQELIQLSTQYQLSDQKYVTLADVIMRSRDLIVISPGEEGEMAKLLNSNRQSEIVEWQHYFSASFSDFYQGISLQGLDAALINAYKQLTVPLVALGNVQYLTESDALPSRVLQVLKSDFRLSEEDQADINQYLANDPGNYSLQPADEMSELFKQAGLGEAVEKTQEIAEMVQLQLDLNEPIMPKFPVPTEEASDSYLRRLCQENLEKRVKHLTFEYQKRLDKELSVISKMGFSDYFLIVWDIMQFAHKQNIYTGSGRGSAAGSLVAYLLEITNVDPIEFDLLFERFLNEERFSLPDIDLDFPDNRREEILEYIFRKYGSKYVAQIGTIGTYGAKSAVRDVCRVLGRSQEEIKQWASAIPSGPSISLKNAIKDKKFYEFVNKSEDNRKVFQIAVKIEGANRHVSTHAAGVVISDAPLISRVPLQRGSGELHITQYTMEAVEKAGLLKLDILGLRNLTILANCIRYIPYENGRQGIDIDQIPFDDQRTLEIFRQGDTDGIFQFESDGIRRVLKRLKPNSFEDVVAVNALYRPGPMEQIDTFIKRKNGSEAIHYPHDDLEEILAPTYGVMVYQEQVMRVATLLAGYSLNEADILRRAIGKKDHQAIEEGRKQFVQGALAKNYSKETALKVYSYIEKFADYGFNRSHAVAYSKVAYQLAYVKANYPASFYTAILKASSKNKIKTLIAEAKLRGVEFLAPDINKSYSSFMLENGKIRFGFDIIQGIPRNFIQEIIQERMNNGEFEGLIDFLNRLDRKWLDKELILPFIHSGAFDHFEETRNSYIHSLSSVLESIQMSHGNIQLFEIFAPTITKKEELSDEEKMMQEHDATGFYFTAEPGEKYNVLRTSEKIQYINDIKKGQFVKIIAVVENIKHIQTKNGEPMSFVDVIDTSGKASLTLFPNIHRRYIQYFDVGDTVIIEGKVEQERPQVKVIVNKIQNPDILLERLEAKEQPATVNEILYVRFQNLANEQRKLDALLKVLAEYRGRTPVIIYDEKSKKQKALKEEFQVELQPKLLGILEKMFAKDNILIKTSKNKRKT